MSVINSNRLDKNRVKVIFIVLMLISGNVLSDPFRDAVPESEQEHFMALIKSLYENQAKADCSDEFFKSKNSPRSLMGWSNRYHNDIVLAAGYEEGKNNTGAITASSGASACYKTIKYRGAVVCLRPDNADYQKHFNETINLCYKLAFE